MLVQTLTPIHYLCMNVLFATGSHDRCSFYALVQAMWEHA